MAIVIDQNNIGSTDANSTAGTVAFTTSQAVAAGGFIVVCGGCFGGGVATGVSGGGLSWALDLTDDGSAGGNGRSVNIASAQAPSGLAIGQTITMTFTASAPARTIAGTSFTGVKTSSPVDVVGTTVRATTAGWTTNSMSIQAGSLIYATNWNEGSITGNTETSPSVEAWQIVNGTDFYGQVGEYRIEASAGSYTVAGAWNAGAGNTTLAVAYLAAAGATPVTNEAALRTAHTPVTWRT